MNRDENDARGEAQPQKKAAKVGDLIAGPFELESLPPELPARIEMIYAFIGPYMSTTLEEFKLAYMRDTYPEHEIAARTAVGFGFQNYVLKFCGGVPPSKSDGSRLLAAILLVSNGVTDPQQLGIPEEAVSRLVACYEELIDSGK